MGFPGAQWVKNPPAMQVMFRRCGFDPWVGKTLEKEMATHSSIPAWKIPWTEETGRLDKVRRVAKELDTT